MLSEEQKKRDFAGVGNKGGNKNECPPIIKNAAIRVVAFGGRWHTKDLYRKWQPSLAQLKIKVQLCAWH